MLYFALALVWTACARANTPSLIPIQSEQPNSSQHGGYAFPVARYIDRELLRSADAGAQDLVYISNNTNDINVVDVYSFSKTAGVHFVEEIIGFHFIPTGLGIDASGALYVCQSFNSSEPVLVFPHGSEEPTLSLNTKGVFAESVAFEPNGDVVVGGTPGPGTGVDLLFYKRGSAEPYREFRYNNDALAIHSMSIDRDSNIYVRYFSISFGTVVGELPDSLNSFRYTVAIGSQNGNPDALAIDPAGSVLLVQGKTPDLVTFPQGKITISRRFPVSPGNEIALNKAGDTLYSVSVSMPAAVNIYAYPSGESLGSISEGGNGIAVYPARALPPSWKSFGI